ncbi:serine hydrolase domain-containing protein [Luminiphilus syltensis]|uniref:hypothetical protein n=1 Tax=Luminiphilus syltensis TaxID=1341119 RepID=UPI0006800869|nr:hypothetical protein [Luminiphilus syltensis]
MDSTKTTIPADPNSASFATELGNASLRSMRDFAMPPGARAPKTRLSGMLTLESPRFNGGFRIWADYYNRELSVGAMLHELPNISFQFSQQGSDLLPLAEGVQRSSHPYWELILQPGKVWSDPSDQGWSLASIPFSLQERAGNCTHNGVLTWRMNNEGGASQASYQFSSETCGYFQFDGWGTAPALFTAGTVEAKAQFRRLYEHRGNRLPVRPLDQLAEDYPGVDAKNLATADGIAKKDTTVLGMVVNGVHYRSDCFTRAGPYPYCDALAIPTYSVAKSLFAAVATLRMQHVYPQLSQQTISSLLPECDSEHWRGVTIENTLDMATGNYVSAVAGDDEASEEHENFIFADTHREKLTFACNYFQRQTTPATQFVYHTSDTYVLGAALQAFLNKHEPKADLYRSVLATSLWRKLELSPLLDDSKRTYDEASHSFTGYGLTVEADDLVRLADWLANHGGHIAGQAQLDKAMLSASLQRDPTDIGLTAGSEALRYNNGFWAFNAADSLGCPTPLWVPFMSGVSGITVAMFPNGVIYYYISDGYVFRWQSGREAAHQITPLCDSAPAL